MNQHKGSMTLFCCRQLKDTLPHPRVCVKPDSLPSLLHSLRRILYFRPLWPDNSFNHAHLDTHCFFGITIVSYIKMRWRLDHNILRGRTVCCARAV